MFPQNTLKKDIQFYNEVGAFWMSQSFGITHIEKKTLKKKGVLSCLFSLGVLGLKHERGKQHAEVKLYLQVGENP